MRVIMIGDIVGQHGCEFVRKQMPHIRQRYRPHLIVANGENSAEGNGILPCSATYLLDSGVDIITLGNHALRRREIYPILEEWEEIIRPANFHPQAPGRGVCIYDRPGLPRVGVINLMGASYMDGYRNPFDVIDDLVEQIRLPIILVDFHAEATAEKVAMAFHLDGRVSAVVGTHTHIQTADERIFPGGTGYITDLGMCGSFYSVLGVRPDLALRRLRTNLPTRFENDKGPCRLSGIFLEIDDKTGKTVALERINLE